MSNDLNRSALTPVVDHTYMRDLPPGAIQLTLLAKPPAHMLKRGKAPLNVVREAPVYQGWSHRGKARAGGVLLSVWQRPGQWATTVGSKMPNNPEVTYPSLDELLELTQATQYKAIATKMTKR